MVELGSGSGVEVGLGPVVELNRMVSGIHKRAVQGLGQGHMRGMSGV